MERIRLAARGASHEEGGMDLPEIKALLRSYNRRWHGGASDEARLRRELASLYMDLQSTSLKDMPHELENKIYETLSTRDLMRARGADKSQVAAIDQIIIARYRARFGEDARSPFEMGKELYLQEFADGKLALLRNLGDLKFLTDLPYLGTFTGEPHITINEPHAGIYAHLKREFPEHSAYLDARKAVLDTLERPAEIPLETPDQTRARLAFTTDLTKRQAKIPILMLQRNNSLYKLLEDPVHMSSMISQVSLEDLMKATENVPWRIQREGLQDTHLAALQRATLTESEKERLRAFVKSWLMRMNLSVTAHCWGKFIKLSAQAGRIVMSHGRTSLPLTYSNVLISPSANTFIFCLTDGRYIFASPYIIGRFTLSAKQVPVSLGIEYHRNLFHDVDQITTNDGHIYELVHEEEWMFIDLTTNRGFPITEIL